MQVARSISSCFDVVIVGGGIIGCATARQLKLLRPSLSIALIEKESEIAKHQSGHNSGVLHAGIYYQPGSLKAKLCVEGIDLAYDYLQQKKIPFKKCGKLVVAAEAEEIPKLETLFARAKQNGCKEIEMVGSSQITELEPHCRGLRAIWSPYTGVVDWGLVTKHYAEDFKQSGGEIICHRPLKSIKPSSGKAGYAIKLESDTAQGTIHTNFVITCAGLFSDRVAAMSGCSEFPKIVPFRGEYLFLKPEKRNLISRNIYPVPDPQFPFLGVHFTPTVYGEVLLGPNAILAFKREGYTFADVSLGDLFESLTFSGMRKLMLKYGVFGMQEFYRSVFVSAQVKQLQKFVPELKVGDVTRGRAGVRAQAIDRNGALVDDFVFDDGQGDLAARLLHVRNAPSPGATSSLAIAKMVVENALNKFKL